MAALLYYCALCNECYRSYGTRPYVCPRCLRATVWRTTPQSDVPRVAWVLTAQDVVFLRINKIAPDLPDEDGA